MSHPRNLFVADRHIRKFISRFPELKYDGTMIYCSICDRYLVGWGARNCQRHIESAGHKRNRKLDCPYWKFLYDVIFMLSVCGIPQRLLDNEHFRGFWKKYVPDWPLPTRRQVRFHFRNVKNLLEHNIRNELRAKPLWISVDINTDAKKNKIGNVLVRVMHPDQSSKPYLIASKRLETLENNAAAAIEQLVLEALNKFSAEKENALILVTDDAECMLKAGALLKRQCSNLLHITCLLHACHLVVETIRDSYPDVDKVIASTKMVSAKADKRAQSLREACAQVPEPPQPRLTKWGMWLQTAFYYEKKLESAKSMTTTIDIAPTSIKNSRQRFGSAQVQKDLGVICKNYEILVKTIEELQNPSLSVGESLEIIDKLNEALQELTDAPGVRAAEKFKDVLNKNPDYGKVRSIKERIRNNRATDIQQNFAYVNITLLDVERSFSKYSEVFSSKRECLSADTLEGMLMMQMYAEARESSFVDKD